MYKRVRIKNGIYIGMTAIIVGLIGSMYLFVLEKEANMEDLANMADGAIEINDDLMKKAKKISIKDVEFI